ncbi:MAG: bifunctional tetrahydrofolate synthase/dihydrofolate synthase [Gammaproteobacteria bacterium]|nr:bifunctional tetrahydrofolate synthase/dihydrofolate synthase [Gammaproteobacteria bacterium]MBU2478940.1 bifunctional tetrahydrofolate synthase/dihydrofolate synthase [Gammaproteobacteria bacterium]
MRFETLAEWLAWQETLHPTVIDLGLERVNAVAARLGLLAPKHTVISVAGTNGKGSSVALLESILVSAGHRVGSYTSPHILNYNERIRIDRQPIADADLMLAFERIDQARGDISLSYFEFGTLAAMDLFEHAALDVALLEVGLGGRLDAVNIQDADVALITAIGIDHVDWLGPDRESIGREKAGIFRAGRPAICSDPAPPQSVRATAAGLAADWYALNEHFGFELRDACWDWWGPELRLMDLPPPALPGPIQVQNAAGVLMVLHCLGERLPVTLQALHTGLQQMRLRGRFEVVPGPIEHIFDVAHNPHAAVQLAAALAARPCRGRTLAVCGMLADKDAAGVAAALSAQVQSWYLGGLDGARGQSAQLLAQRMGVADQNTHLYADVLAAYEAACEAAQTGDRILIFGSFHTIAELLPAAYNAGTV